MHPECETTMGWPWNGTILRDEFLQQRIPRHGRAYTIDGTNSAWAGPRSIPGYGASAGHYWSFELCTGSLKLFLKCKKRNTRPTYMYHFNRNPKLVSYPIQPQHKTTIFLRKESKWWMMNGGSSLLPNKVHPPFVSYSIQISFFISSFCFEVLLGVGRPVRIYEYIYIWFLLLFVGLRFRWCGGGSQGETFVDPL